MRNLLQLFSGESESIWTATELELCGADGINQRIANQIRNYSDKEFSDRQLDIAGKSGVRAISFWDDDYPQLLKKIYDPPLILFVKGQGLEYRQDCLGLVGSRQVTDYGRRVIKKLVKELCESHVVMVSGLARGVDTIVHQETLRFNGCTLAVLGSGMDWIYPAENRKLYDQIVESGGALITEFPFGTKPDAGNFPRRNRIISGLSHGIVVIEAGNRSGAILTAMNAIDQNREVFAVPGRMFDKQSIGTNRLIRHGAIPVIDGNQILDMIQNRLFHPAQPRQESIPLELSKRQRIILSFLSGDPIHIDDLANATEMDISILLSDLLQLEMNGLVNQLAGKMFVAN